MSVIKGKVWKFGDGVDTDIIIPARYLILPLEEMKHKAMEPVKPEFAEKVNEGDIIVAGQNFGCGSSREQAPAALKALGIRAIVAASFARIFYRNAINLGLPVIECRDLYEQVDEGDVIEITPLTGKIRMPENGMEFSGSTLPDFLLEIINNGGLIPYLSAKFKTS
ncbi:MAG: 3-isopropylmalate dehydratase small subunit [Desulfobacteraceae bacterium]|nr:3-isopropylmalate dehydratase small subunit [Desulfobacteraceae bacterium]